MNFSDQAYISKRSQQRFAATQCRLQSWHTSAINMLPQQSEATPKKEPLIAALQKLPLA
jgi:hypothetical protein